MNRLEKLTLNHQVTQKKAYLEEQQLSFEYKKEQTFQPFYGYLDSLERPTPNVSLDENSTKILAKRYFQKDSSGKPIEDSSGMMWRVAKNIALADLLYQANTSKEALSATSNDFYNILANLYFLPGSPCLMNAGKELQQLAACYVLPIEDNMENIFEMVKSTALIHKSGGGTGFNFSKLRPRYDRVSSTQGVPSGVMSFMKVFNSATEEVKQGGTRRGANMGILNYDHWEILDFIHSKEVPMEYNNFNLSVAISEKFMELKNSGGYFPLYNDHTNQNMKAEMIPERKNVTFNTVVAPSGNKFNRPNDGLSREENKIYDNYTGKEIGIVSDKGEVMINARSFFDYIVGSTWSSGEPGIIFMDRMDRANPTPEIGRICSTNPCGEQPLLPFEACNLGSINLEKMVTEDNRLDKDLLIKTVHTAVHFMDNVVDMTQYPLPENFGIVMGNRKLGLGVMGFANLLLKLGIEYGSKNSIDIAHDVMQTIDTESKIASSKLGESRGVFPNFKNSIYDQKGKHYDPELARKYPGLDLSMLRNATTTTIAPTGTISMIAGTSSGVEPLYSVVFESHRMDTVFKEVSPLFIEVAKRAGFYSDGLIDKIKEKGTIQGIPEIPTIYQNMFKGANDISLEAHVGVQEAFQIHTDNAVSKTVNMKHTATLEDVARVYDLSYAGVVKGVTLYRDGSRDEQVLNLGNKKINIITHPKIARVKIEPPKVLNIMHARKYAVPTPRGKVHFTVSDELYELKTDPSKRFWLPREMFMNIAPIGSEINVETQMGGLKDSYILQAENPNYVNLIKNLKSTKSPGQSGFGETAIFSIPHAEGLVLEYHLNVNGVIGTDKNTPQLVQVVWKKDLERVKDVNVNDPSTKYYGTENDEEIKLDVTANIEGENTCPDCKSPLLHQDGCHGGKCINPGCGYSSCK